jgi:Protein of unknown function (DUF2490)
MKKRAVLFFLWILGNSFVFAQTEKSIDHQSLMWTRYTLQIELSKKFAIVPEIDERFFLKPVQQNLFLTRIQARYKIDENVVAGAGFAYFAVNKQIPNVDLGHIAPEYRFQQDVTIKQNFNKFGFNERYQIEERFITAFDKNGTKTGTDFFMRYRFKLQAEYKFWEKKDQYLKAIVYDEVMFNSGKKIIYNTFDQNRIYAAVQYGFNPSLSLELGYLNSYQQRSNGTDYFDRDIIRVSFLKTIKI